MTGLSVPKSKFISIFCEAVLHGVYTVLIGAALYVLFRKRREQRLHGNNIIMIISTLLMYSMNTMQIAFALRLDLIAFFDQHAIEGGVTIFEDHGGRWDWLQDLVQVVNCFIGDAIVVWRTWVLCGCDNRVLIFPVVCIAGVVVSGLKMIVALSKLPPGQNFYPREIIVLFSTFSVLSCVTNVYAVALMSWKAWAHTRFMKRMHFPIALGRHWSAILLIIESGFVFCVAMIITIVLFLVNRNNFYIMVPMLSYITGIYPTIIIVLVCLKITYADEVTRAETFTRQIVNGSSTKHPENLSWHVAGNPDVTTAMPGSGFDSVSNGDDELM